jgi:hypothetical protein
MSTRRGSQRASAIPRIFTLTSILAGTLLVGYGEQFDEGKMKALPAGSPFTEPARHPHFAWAKDGEVVIQVVGHGPSDTTWLLR